MSDEQHQHPDDDQQQSKQEPGGWTSGTRQLRSLDTDSLPPSDNNKIPGPSLKNRIKKLTGELSEPGAAPPAESTPEQSQRHQQASPDRSGPQQQTDRQQHLNASPLSQIDQNEIGRSQERQQQKMTRQEATSQATETPWQIVFQPVDQALDPFTVKVRSTVVVGRSDPDSITVPDLDLDPYGGSKQGVSRQHALLLPNNEGLWLVDLDSTNGTWVNGLYLQPGMKYRLRSGDQVDFGTLKLMVRVIGEISPSSGGSSDDDDDPGSTIVSRKKPRRM